MSEACPAPVPTRESFLVVKTHVCHIALVLFDHQVPSNLLPVGTQALFQDESRCVIGLCKIAQIRLTGLIG